MNSKDFLKEGFVEDATDVHMDHEVQMAREECYHAAEHALAIHKLLRNISEQQGLEGWVSSKITLANDYLNTVREHLEYELLQPQIDDVAIGLPIAENEQQGVAEGLEDKTAQQRKTERDKQRTAPAQKARNAAQRKGLTQDKDGTYYAKEGVAEGLTKQARARKEAESVKAAIERLEQQLKDPNPHIDKDDIRRRLETEKRRLDLYRDVLDEQGVAEAKLTGKYKPKRTALEKFRDSMKKSGYDMDAAAKRLEAFLAKQKEQRAELDAKYADMDFREKEKTKALSEWRKQQRAKKIREQGITDQEIQQRIQPSFQATDAQLKDPEWMRARGLVPMQDIEAGIKTADEQGQALNQAQKAGFPTYQHQGQTYGVMNPKYGKGGSTGQPKPLTPQQIQQTAGTNIVSGSGAPVTAGSKMLTPNQRMGGVNETTAGSVAGVVNPKSSKPKNQVGSLFGGTYTQKRKGK